MWLLPIWKKFEGTSSSNDTKFTVSIVRNLKLTEIFVKLPSSIPYKKIKIMNPMLTFLIFKILPQDPGSRDPNVLWTLGWTEVQSFLQDHAYEIDHQELSVRL